MSCAPGPVTCPGTLSLPLTQVPMGHTGMRGHAGLPPSMILHSFFVINEIIYNLLKKFLLDGDRFPCWCGIPTLHPGLCPGSRVSSSSSGPSFVACSDSVFCESFNFGGCGVTGLHGYYFFLLRWSIALCW